MEFGVNVPNYGDRTTPAEILRWVRFAEGVGYQLAMVSDHIALTPEVERLFPAPFYDPFATLAWLAGQTTRIRLGTTVIVLPYRHPLQMARLSANIDQFSGGRLVLGVAAGWAPEEFAAVGMPYHQRGRIADESLAAIKALWTRSVTEFDGEHVSFGPVATGPSPLQRPHPPIWVGGHSPGALRRAVRYADAWHPTSVRVGYLAGVGMPELRKIADRESLPAPGLAPRIKLRITDRPLPDTRRLMGEGTIDQIREDLSVIAGLNATHVVFDTTYPGQTRRLPAECYWESLEHIADEVIDLESGALR
ncbi:LLM class flavin-dependent oxidoreductase [Actinoallomurus acanthiterrae]